MKIVFLTRRFYPSIGGVETHVFNLSKELMQKGHRVVVITEKFDKLEEKDSIDGILVYRIQIKEDDCSFGKTSKMGSVKPLRINTKKFHIWKWLFLHRKLIEQSDIIHCHDVFFWYLPFRLVYPTKPIFTTFHGYETEFPPSKKAIFMRKISEKLSFGNICVGEFIKKWYGTKANYVIYGGVNKIKNEKLKIKKYLSTSSSLSLRADGLSSRPKGNSKLKVMFVGRLEKDTGVPIYLKTLKILMDKGIKFEFEACGDGGLRRNVEKYGEVHGFLRNIDSHFANADIVFASSYLSMLDAFAHKKPVYAVYDNQLKKDYREMTPFSKWVTIEDKPKILAGKLEYLINNPTTLERMVDASYGWAKKQTWKKVAETYIRLWSMQRYSAT